MIDQIINIHRCLHHINGQVRNVQQSIEHQHNHRVKNIDICQHLCGDMTQEILCRRVTKHHIKIKRGNEIVIIMQSLSMVLTEALPYLSTLFPIEQIRRLGISSISIEPAILEMTNTIKRCDDARIFANEQFHKISQRYKTKCYSIGINFNTKNISTIVL